MKEVFATRRAHLRIGLLSLAFFLSMLVLSILAGYDAPTDRKILAVLFLGGFWSFWVGLSVWVVFAYFKESVTLGDADVRFTHVLGERTIALAEVLRACWRWRYSCSSLKLFLRDGKEMLRFDNFRPDQRRRLIEYFRERISRQVQEGWNEELERYFSEAEAKAKESTAELAKFLRSLWRPVVIAGSISGIACGLLLHLYALKLGVEGLPSWSGSPLLDWFGRGLLAGGWVLAGLWMLYWALRWIYQSE